MSNIWDFALARARKKGGEIDSVAVLAMRDILGERLWEQVPIAHYTDGGVTVSTATNVLPGVALTFVKTLYETVDGVVELDDGYDEGDVPLDGDKVTGFINMSFSLSGVYDIAFSHTCSATLYLEIMGKVLDAGGIPHEYRGAIGSNRVTKETEQYLQVNGRITLGEKNEMYSWYLYYYREDELPFILGDAEEQ